MKLHAVTKTDAQAMRPRKLLHKKLATRTVASVFSGDPAYLHMEIDTMRQTSVIKRTFSFFRKTTDLLERLRFHLWKLKNPERPFAAYYVERKSKKIDSGHHHGCLGTSWARSKSRVSVGRKTFELLVDWGLRPNHVCADYGCGSLRVGLHLIGYLDAGNYWGLDVTDRFYKHGVALLGEAQYAAKKPHLAVIDPSIFPIFQSSPPDFVFSQAVLSHVPPHEVDHYFSNLLRLVGPQTKLLLIFPEARTPTQLNTMSWAYPAHFVASKIRDRRPTAIIEIDPAEPHSSKPKHGRVTTVTMRISFSGVEQHRLDRADSLAVS